LAEEFDPVGARYKVIFRCHPELKGQNTKIRFFGGTFGKGRFSIEVLRASEWWVEYDNPDESSSFSSSSNSFSFSPNDASPQDILSRRSSMFFDTKTDTHEETSKPTTPWSVGSDEPPSWTKKSSTNDPSTLPGSQGPCTLVIKNTITNVPIQVIISKTPPPAQKTAALSSRRKQPVKKVSQVFGQAAKDIMERSRSTTIDDLYQKMGISDNRLAVGLENTRNLLRRLSTMDNDSSDYFSSSPKPVSMSALSSSRLSRMSSGSMRNQDSYLSSSRNLSSISSKSADSDYQDAVTSLNELSTAFDRRRVSMDYAVDEMEIEEDRNKRRKSEGVSKNKVQRPTDPRTKSDSVIKKVRF
jgi:hypothetical protein